MWLFLEKKKYFNFKVKTDYSKNNNVTEYKWGDKNTPSNFENRLFKSITKYKGYSKVLTIPWSCMSYRHQQPRWETQQLLPCESFIVEKNLDRGSTGVGQKGFGRLQDKVEESPLFWWDKTDFWPPKKDAMFGQTLITKTQSPLWSTVVVAIWCWDASQLQALKSVWR